MKTYARKEFEVREGSTNAMYYRIELLEDGRVVEVFERPTMREAQQALAAAGYTIHRRFT